MYSEENVPHGKAVIVSAPSGAGKTTIVRRLLERDELRLTFSVSATTRQRREYEVEGRDYYFFSLVEFDKAIERGDFIEWQEVYPGQKYGTLRSEVERIWSIGRNVIFDVDVFGGMNIRKILGDRAVSLFIRPPDMEALKSRLMNRRSETEESMRTRLEKASLETQYETRFDTIVVNAELEHAVSECYSIVSHFLMGKR